MFKEFSPMFDNCCDTQTVDMKKTALNTVKYVLLNTAATALTWFIDRSSLLTCVLRMHRGKSSSSAHFASVPEQAKHQKCAAAVARI